MRHIGAFAGQSVFLFLNRLSLNLVGSDLQSKNPRSMDLALAELLAASAPEVDAFSPDEPLVSCSLPDDAKRLGLAVGQTAT